MPLTKITAGTADDILLHFVDGAVLVVQDVPGQFDGLDGSIDGSLDADTMRANLNQYMYLIEDTTGMGFTITPGPDAHMIIERDNGEVFIISDGSKNSYDVYTTTGTLGGADDYTIDVAALSANAGEGGIYSFVDSSGLDFEIIPGGSGDFVIQRSDGQILVIDNTQLGFYDRSTLTGPLDGTIDGEIDIAALAANLDFRNIYSIEDSSGGDFTVISGPANHLYIQRDDGTVLVLPGDGLPGYDNYEAGGTNTSGPNDGVVDIAAVVDNLTDDRSTYIIEDTSGMGFTVTSGIANTLIITRDNGQVYSIERPRMEDTYDAFDGSVDHRVDIAEFDDNLDTRFLMEFYDSSGMGFTVSAGDNGSLLIVRDDGYVLRINGTSSFLDGGTAARYDNMDGLNDGRIDIVELINNLGVTQIYDFGTLTPTSPMPCFVLGSMISTPKGNIAVEELYVGDLVTTLDRGAQPIRWIGKRKITAKELKSNAKITPIRIRAGALGKNLPVRDMFVSPQHRLLVTSNLVGRMFGSRRALVAAKQLLEVEGIDYADVEDVTYVHFLCDQHEIVFCENTPTESLYTGKEALKSVPKKSRKEIFSIFPELIERDLTYVPAPAAVLVSGRRGRKFANRAVQNNRNLIEVDFDLVS